MSEAMKAMWKSGGGINKPKMLGYDSKEERNAALIDMNKTMTARAIAEQFNADGYDVSEESIARYIRNGKVQNGN